MHALWNIHAALRPGGVLVDLHPQPAHGAMDVNTVDGVVVAGFLDDSVLIPKIIRARAALAEVVETGGFVTERTETFSFLITYDGVLEWLDQVATVWVSTIVPPSVVDRVRELLPSGDGLIAAREACHAARLRRAEPPRPA